MRREKSHIMLQLMDLVVTETRLRGREKLRKLNRFSVNLKEENAGVIDA